MRTREWRLSLLMAATIAAGASINAVHAADAFTAQFTWEGTGKCFEPQSPPFTLSNVPPGTKSLHFNLTDLDFLPFQHGGGTVPYDGKDAIARGAFAYRGPCPPTGQHHYEWTIEALDAGGKVLAETKIMHEFPSQ